MKRKNLKSNINAYLNWPIVLAIYLIVMVVVLYFVNEIAGLVGAIFILCYTAFALYLRWTRFNGFYSEIVSAAEKISKKQKLYYDKIDLPHAIIDESGRILWGNENFFAISKDLAVGRSIKHIFEELNNEILKNLKDEKVDILTSYDDRKYRAHLRIIKFDELNEKTIENTFDEDAKMILLYLSDETEYYDLKQENDNNKQVIGFIYIDNYYEIADSMDDSKASMLIAMVDRRLTRYISYNSGIIKKLEKDKYFFVTTKKEIEDMIKDRFSILEQTKEILDSDNVPLTLSIGVGYEGKSVESNHDLARMAIDMALGRGGDQAVVKCGQETLFFGGRSASATTNVRVRARVKATSFREVLDTKDKVLIMGHKNGDFDSFGASVGVYIMAKQIGKEAHIVVNSLTKAVDDMKQKYVNNDVYANDMFVSGDVALGLCDEETLLVVVDHNTSKISDEERLYDKGLDIVVFDHHRVGQNALTDAILAYIDAGASSTCELISEVMTYFDDELKVRPLEADTMLAGIMIDTMYFTYQTSAKTFDAASFLRKKGADSDRVRKILRVDIEFEKLKNQIVADAMYYKGAYAIAAIKDYAGNVELSVAKAEIANELIDIKGVKASFVISHENNHYMVSGRSIDEINVQVVMEKFGGGGHRSSAGATLNVESFDEAVNLICKTIDEYEIEDGDKK